jgi:hypothetical protein
MKGNLSKVSVQSWVADDDLVGWQTLDGLSQGAGGTLILNLGLTYGIHMYVVSTESACCSRWRFLHQLPMVVGPFY